MPAGNPENAGVRTGVGLRRRGWVGLGLLALLVVLGIVLVLYFGNFGGSSYSQQMATSRQTARDIRAGIETRQLVLLIATTRQQTGRVPMTPADFEDVPPGTFRDPWGGELRWDYDDPRAPTQVTIRSAGADGEWGTDDDVAQDERLPF
jgi:type II secretory pathway pseudopilin PulG